VLHGHNIWPLINHDSCVSQTETPPPPHQGAGVDEDGMTAVSGLTGLHSSYDGGEPVAEQDLSGGWG
jgi:hypothetical protein